MDADQVEYPYVISSTSELWYLDVIADQQLDGCGRCDVQAVDHHYCHWIDALKIVLACSWWSQYNEHGLACHSGDDRLQY